MLHTCLSNVFTSNPCIQTTYTYYEKPKIAFIESIFRCESQDINYHRTSSLLNVLVSVIIGFKRYPSTNYLIQGSCAIGIDFSKKC